MLTDRQEKFYRRIINLLQPSSKILDKERKYLVRAKKEIELGNPFSDSLKGLNLSLKRIIF
ncbi:hypothetical protein [Lactovum odontotermitis]